MGSVHLCRRQLLLHCSFYYVHTASGHSQWVAPAATGGFDHSPAAGGPTVRNWERWFFGDTQGHTQCAPRCRCKQCGASSHPERVGRAGLRGSDRCSFGFDGLQVGASGIRESPSGGGCLLPTSSRSPQGTFCTALRPLLVARGPYSPRTPPLRHLASKAPPLHQVLGFAVAGTT